jgi:hypothetical protein
MRLRLLLSSVSLACFVITNSGRIDFGLVTPASAQADPSAAASNGPAPVRTISISMTPEATIDPLIYGVNYVWATTSQADFPSWISALEGTQTPPSAPVSLVRYPGGWDGEWYDWSTNTLEPGGPTYSEPGVSPAALLSSILPLTSAQPLSANWFSAINANGKMRSGSFQLPIRQVIGDQTPSEVPARIALIVHKYHQIVLLCENSVQYWEFGNEWWLQAGAAANPAPLSTNAALSRNLARYAALVAAAAPALKASFPNIKLFATADWRTAGGPVVNDEFVQLRKAVGPTAWALIDGISIHPYCGTNVPRSVCTSIPEHVAKIKQETGKSNIYASEWAVVMDQSTDDYGIRNANATVSALQDFALAGISEGAYWPSIGSVPAIALASPAGLTSTGVLFRTMSLVYEGQALAAHVSNNGGPVGQTVAVAAKNNLMGVPGVAVIIPTNGDGLETIDLSLAGTGLTKVAESSVIYSPNPNIKTGAIVSKTVALNTSIITNNDGSSTAQFVLNPGTPGRGSNWEIAVLELQ